MRTARLAVCLVLALCWAGPCLGQAQKSLNKCQSTVGKAARKYVTDLVKTYGACLDAASKAVIEKSGTAADAAGACEGKLKAIVNSGDASKTLAAKFAAKVGKACDPNANPALQHTIEDVLGTSGSGEDIEAQNLNVWCQNFGGDPTIDNLAEWNACIVSAATCQARQLVGTLYPRALEWIAALQGVLTGDALTALDDLDNGLDSNNDGQLDIACGPANG